MKKSHIIGFILIILATFLYFIANIQRVAIPGAIFDLLQHDLHADAKNITALGTTFMYIYAISQLGIGVLISRYGGFKVITAGGILFFLGCIFFPLTSNISFMYLSRIFIGIGAATFYLGIIDELKHIVSSRNFGVALSSILLIGYLGGIVANAPLVFCVNHIGWRETFLLIGIATATIAILFILLDRLNFHRPTDTNVRFNLSPFKEVLTNKKNLTLYLTVCINYSLYYLFQTILGKKFLEDFCQFSTINAAIILSIMGALFAISGPLCAFISKGILYRKTIFFKFTSLNLLTAFTIILICLCLNIRTPLIGVLFCIIPIGTNLSPLAVPLLQSYNSPKVSATSVSCMTFSFYLLVGILGSISGVLLDLFTPAGIKTYSSQSYITIFTIMVILSIISFVNVFRITESKKTIQLIKHVKYLKEHSDKNQPENYNHYID